MTKNLEKLIYIKYDDNYKRLREKLIVDILEDFEKRIKRLEQAQTHQTGGVGNIITNDGQKLLIDVNYKEGEE